MTCTEMRPAIGLRQLTRPGVEALKRYWGPFLLLQLVAFAVLAGYAISPAFREACRLVAKVRTAGGMPLCAVSAALAGAVLPEIARTLTGSRRWDAERANLALYNLFVFAGSGIMVDLQMRLLNILVGADNSLRTAAIKVLLDQFVLSMIYGFPYFLLIYGWREHGFRVRPLRREIGLRWYLERVLPLSTTGWAYWIPMSFVIYSMPAPLQFCLWVPIFGAWSILLLLIVAHTATTRRAGIVETCPRRAA